MASRNECKAAKAAAKEERKNWSATRRWARRGKKLLVVIGVIVVVIAAVALALLVSFQARHASTAAPHESASEWEARAYEEASDGGILAQEILREGAEDKLYVSTQATGWGQASPDYSSQVAAWGGAYDGEEPFKIMSAYCANCHTKEELGLYRADAAGARAKIASMVEDYGCTQLTDAQVEILIDFYTE